MLLADQGVSILAGAASAVFAKVALQSMPVPGFLLVFATVSVLLNAPAVDLGALRRFASDRFGVLAIVTNLVAMLMFYLGLKGLDPGAHAFLSRTQVAFGFMLAYWMFGERFGRLRLGLALACVLSALASASPEPSGAWPWPAVIATLTGAFLFALNLALLRRAPTSTAPAAPAVAYNLALIPFVAILLDGAFLPALAERPTMLLCAAAAAALASVSLYCYTRSTPHLAFFESTAMRAFSPFIVVLVAMPFFPVKLSALGALGAVTMTLVLLAIAFTNAPKPDIKA